MCKKNLFCFLLFFNVFFVSCSKDLSNDELALYIKYAGLNPQEVKVLANSKEILKNEIKFGQQLTIELNGIDDFEVDKFNFVHPGGENSVVDEDNNVIYFVEDYFNKYGDKGVSPENAEALKFNLTIGKPMIPGKSYHFLFKIWDKLNKKELKGNMEIKVI
ncbi:hypothetical protein EGI22_07485 [Lacihabitans sp. LS3-19]|uniref:hypothetical protein n=1 Tax=Lacihabitans sp. LS3-19 TaxID=2487335 RepID=UPI0020CF67D5|nr:hypothetical protein [Lacihabitans sp. LS3-19]MCP9767751.1 hypothetical protein [Lacihabitans sp. LS3-19]